ncbi:hypothetical protein GQ42DRAFT_152471 [Ramicandelaber brevisporus]|nr:hypothetical protein GQ42DRAFT_152471 [Ramicandelaber brevisporus]
MSGYYNSAPQYPPPAYDYNKYGSNAGYYGHGYSQPPPPPPPPHQQQHYHYYPQQQPYYGYAPPQQQPVHNNYYNDRGGGGMDGLGACLAGCGLASLACFCCDALFWW